MNDMADTRYSASHYARSPEGACRTMWASVIYRAVADAQGIGMPTPKDIREAQSWLDGGGRDFQTVCVLAGLEPSSVHAAWKDGRLTYERLREAMTDEQKRKQARRQYHTTRHGRRAAQ